MAMYFYHRIRIESVSGTPSPDAASIWYSWRGNFDKSWSPPVGRLMAVFALCKFSRRKVTPPVLLPCAASTISPLTRVRAAKEQNRMKS
jgi:hypothetical protein